MSYLSFMTSAFDQLYRADRDVWSTDLGLRATTERLARVLAPNSHVLDVGCGAARDSKILLTLGHQVTGVDLIRHEEWTRLEQTHPGRVQFHASSFQELATGVYDAILDNGCFHHQRLDERAAYVARVRSQLRPGGIYALNVYAPKNQDQPGRDTHLDDGRVASVYDPERLAQWLEGFALIQTERVPSSVHAGAYLLALARRTP